jgi:hypothetical protein
MIFKTARTLGLFAVLCAAFAISAGPAPAATGGGLRLSPPTVSPVNPPTGPTTAPGSPYRRAGMWIWYVDRSHGGNVQRIIQRARRSKIGTLYIKSGDGTNVWSQFTPGLVDRFQRAGLKVCGWQYVYGRNPIGEAKVSAVAKRRGADCFVIDAEAEYEGNYSGADLYIRKLRQLVGPRFRLSLSSFPYANYHPAFPYSVFLGPGAATDNLPQIYWKTIGDTPVEAFGVTYTYNRMYKRPIYPVGQTYEDPSARELTQVRRLSLNYGVRPSWWSWEETNSNEWATLARALPGRYPRYRAIRTHPTARRGDRGDSIVWLQQHLVGARLRVTITGIFGPQTYRAVRQFQNSRGLKVDGVVGNSTWNRLLRVKPVRVAWSRARSRSRSAGISSAVAGPLSASLPPVRNEIAGVKRAGR